LDPQDIDIGSYGVQFTGFDDKPCKRGSGTCPSLRFFIPPVDPAKPGTLTQAQLDSLQAATPEKILWDLDRDGKTDVTCPATAPVMRTMLSKGVYFARAVIVAKDSATSGVFGEAAETIFHFANFGVTGDLRKGQPFACRTSLE